MTDSQERELKENTRMTTELHTMLVKNGLVQAIKDIRTNMVTKDTCELNRDNCAAIAAATRAERGKWFKSINGIIVLIVSISSLLLGSGVLFRTVANSRENKKSITQNERAIKQNEELKNLLRQIIQDEIKTDGVKP